ncbi:uncharacterized protein LOC143529748 [Bidens hawaiensis]|uniref:uncharacterized protein LOC143529748 n=1 Tax=Bidens hawaiensis TaxID=980011 RepID=UPI004049912E
MGDESSNKEPVAIKKGGTSMTFQCLILNSTNYTIWAVRIRAIFNVHGIWEVVEPNAETEAEVVEKKNNMAIALLYQALPENMVLQIANLTSAKDIWDALKVRHVGIDIVKQAHIETLESDFESLKMNVNESLDVYAEKISQIASQASSLGHTLDDKRLVRKLLGSVPEKYIQIVAAIEQFANLNTMSFQEAVGRLKAFEERTKKQTKEEDVSGKLLFTETNEKEMSKHHKCEHCGCGNSYREGFGRGQGKGRGSDRSRGDGRVQQDKRHIRCHKCHELGHYKNECPTWEKKEESNLIHEEDEEPTLL